MLWLVNNLGSLIAIVAAVLGLVTTWVLYGADIRQLKKNNERLEEELKELRTESREHQANTSLHIDPHRDEKRWDDLKSEIFRRFDTTDRKIDRLMLNAPAFPLPPAS